MSQMQFHLQDMIKILIIGLQLEVYHLDEKINGINNLLEKKLNKPDMSNFFILVDISTNLMSSLVSIHTSCFNYNDNKLDTKC